MDSEDRFMLLLLTIGYALPFTLLILLWIIIAIVSG